MNGSNYLVSELFNNNNKVVTILVIESNPTSAYIFKNKDYHVKNLPFYGVGVFLKVKMFQCQFILHCEVRKF